MCIVDLQSHQGAVATKTFNIFFAIREVRKLSCVNVTLTGNVVGKHATNQSLYFE